MPVLLITGGALQRHDTRAAVTSIGTSRQDAALAVSTDALIRQDLKALACWSDAVFADIRLSVLLAAVSVHDTRLVVAVSARRAHDTRFSVSVSATSRADVRLLANPAASFIHPSQSVFFPFGPARPVRRAVNLFQMSDRASDAALYVYNKGISGRTVHRLTFPQVDGATLGDLKRFVQKTVRGVRTEFTWRDHAGLERTVRMSDATLRNRQIGPDRHAVEIELTEDLP